MSKQILWFRRDLRVSDNEILFNANNEVLPIFIFDPNILNKLNRNDKRLTFIYNSVLNLKTQLKNINLDLKIYFDEPINVFNSLKNQFDEILCSCDYDNFSIQRDLDIEKIIPLKRFYDSYILNPNEGLKENNFPYTIFTPFYKSLKYIWDSNHLNEFSITNNLKLFNDIDYMNYPSLKDLGFNEQLLDEYLLNTPYEILNDFIIKIENYSQDRDYFYKDSTSKLGIFLRFGLISPREVFNYIKSNSINNDIFIKELFWREFWAYILYHLPHSEYENFNGLNVNWNKNIELFNKWCNGETGIPIIDAAMIHFNHTGEMHNRLRMIVSSFLCKNLFLPWQWGEQYFASKLLDYDAASNIGSWQWSASTGADGSPYFRVFNPYTQSEKFDKDGIFIKSILNQYKDVDPKLFHIENGISNSIVNIKISRLLAIQKFKNSL